MRSSTGDGAHLSIQLLDKEEYDEVHGYEYTPREGKRSSYNRPISRKQIYGIGALIILVLLGAAAIRDHVLPSPLPKLDTTSEAVKNGNRKGQKEKPEQYRKAVVIASYADQNVTWLNELNSDVTKGWEIYRYVGDGGPDEKKKNYLTVPNSDGRESLAYLTYIVDHYDDIADYNVFIHGHERAWHQPEYILDKLSAINLDALHKEQFFNLRCPTAPGCEADTKFYYDGTHLEDHRAATQMADFWLDKMQDSFGPLPMVVGRKCCAQFAASKAAILQQPKLFWEIMREPLLDDPTKQREKWREGMSGHRVGLYYENIWHIMMGKPADYCPSTEHCEKVQFNDKVHCDGDIKSWDERQDWESISCWNDLRKADGPPPATDGTVTP